MNVLFISVWGRDGWCLLLCIALALVQNAPELVGPGSASTFHSPMGQAEGVLCAVVAANDTRTETLDNSSSSGLK